MQGVLRFARRHHPTTDELLCEIEGSLPNFQYVNPRQESAPPLGRLGIAARCFSENDL